MRILQRQRSCLGCRCFFFRTGYCSLRFVVRSLLMRQGVVVQTVVFFLNLVSFGCRSVVLAKMAVSGIQATLAVLTCIYIVAVLVDYHMCIRNQ